MQKNLITILYNGIYKKYSKKFLNMIILEHIKVFFPDKTLFDDLNWQINSGSRIGLIGDNGVGKTTLFKILVGQHEPDEGKVILPDNHDIGYLPQDLILLNDYLLKDYLQEAAGIIQLKNKMKQYQQELSEVNSENLEFERIARRYEKTSHQFGIKGGYSFEARAKSIIKGLGFTDQDWIKPCSYFSGGWKMRVVLAGLLVSSPDILLLDEPTNHMDTESLEWLESWLKDYNGILLIISHDRYFLDKVVKETVELANRKIIVYKGNYSFYLTEKNKREELQEKHQKHLQEKKEHLETFIERFRYKATDRKSVV